MPSIKPPYKFRPFGLWKVQRWDNYIHIINFVPRLPTAVLFLFAHCTGVN